MAISLSRAYIVTKARVTPRENASLSLSLSHPPLPLSLSIGRWSSCTQRYGLVGVGVLGWRSFRGVDGRLHGNSAGAADRRIAVNDQPDAAVLAHGVNSSSV